MTVRSTYVLLLLAVILVATRPWVHNGIETTLWLTGAVLVSAIAVYRMARAR